MFYSPRNKSPVIGTFVLDINNIRLESHDKVKILSLIIDNKLKFKVIAYFNLKLLYSHRHLLNIFIKKTEEIDVHRPQIFQKLVP